MELAGELLQGLTLVKMGSAVLMVLGLSLVAEHASPRLAGVLSGYPLGAALCLFFYGYEISPEFAAESSIHTLAGLSATAAFAFGYWRGALFLKKASKSTAITAATLGGMICYTIAALLIERLTLSLWSAMLTALISIALFDRLFRRIENSKIQQKQKLGFQIMAARALAAGLIIMGITTAAKFLPPGWAGVLAAFPMALFPFLAVIHFTYEIDHVSTVIKNVPRGLICLVIYSALVWWTYPKHGLFIGTLEGYLGATAYLVFINYLNTRKSRR